MASLRICYAIIWYQLDDLSELSVALVANEQCGAFEMCTDAGRVELHPFISVCTE